MLCGVVIALFVSLEKNNAIENMNAQTKAKKTQNQLCTTAGDTYMQLCYGLK